MKSPICICNALLLALFTLPFNLQAQESEEEARLPLQDLQLFAQIFDQVRNTYVEEVDDQALIENAIIGLLGRLDPHSAYLSANSYGDLQQHTTGEFGGLGIEVGIEDGLIKVVAPMDDTPAQRAGILPGDYIVKMDEQVIQGVTLQDALELMRGPVGSMVHLTVIRKGAKNPIEVDLTRELIKVNSVRSQELEPGFGYIRIAQFQMDTGAKFKAALSRLSQHETPLRGLVFDLRNNPGGLLPASIEVADALLDNGMIVYTEGRIPSANTKQYATEGDILQGIPVVVLINGGTASASEIVAGALQDHRRAVILGTNSFGKGSVQTVLPLGDGRAIKLTTARYFTPNGRSIQAEGIRPDIHVELAEIRPLDIEEAPKEANLSRHLGNGRPQDELLDNSYTQGSPYLQDNQLFEGLNLLKGIAIMRTKN